MDPSQPQHPVAIPAPVLTGRVLITGFESAFRFGKDRQRSAFTGEDRRRSAQIRLAWFFETPRRRDIATQLTRTTQRFGKVIHWFASHSTAYRTARLTPFSRPVETRETARTFPHASPNRSPGAARVAEEIYHGGTEARRGAVSGQWSVSSQSLLPLLNLLSPCLRASVVNHPPSRQAPFPGAAAFLFPSPPPSGKGEGNREQGVGKNVDGILSRICHVFCPGFCPAGGTDDLFSIENRYTMSRSAAKTETSHNDVQQPVK